jgi:Protein of unknown function (DUF1648).
MKFSKIDILVLVVPVIIMILLMPVLPDKVPIHWAANGVVNGFIDRKYSFVLGLLPFAIYKSIKIKYGIK